MNNLTKMFWSEGLALANYPRNYLQSSLVEGHRKFTSFFGVSPEVCGIVWTMIKEKPRGAEPKHLLWCLMFLKRKNTEHVSAAIVKADEKTYRLWVWTFVNLISKLDVVKWENRFDSNSSNQNIYVTLDGTDYRICEPTKFSSKWYSHKFHAAGVRYEIGISIGRGYVVWATGGFPCGEWSDLKIANDLYIHYAKDEITLADEGYRLPEYFKQPSNAREHKLLSRHETLNGRLKNFEILNQRFRNNLKKHPAVFHACINVIQISIEHGETLFDVC